QINLQQDLNEQTRLLYPSMTKMVFGNILRNALNYSQGSEIDIIVQKNKVLIADNGIGINLPNDVKVHELSCPQLKLQTKGHGIGLQLVQKLSRQLGWRVELFDRQYYLTIHNDIALMSSTGLVVVVYLN
ncbi:MAG: ATP-binding protein, partial [Chryseobacterium sp.]|nr:ATP-binding protein [Chryseobacterium sp.]